MIVPDAVNPFFETGNRGKRSIALDLNRDEGKALLHKLIAGADVFITNLREDARIKLGIEPADLMKINPRLIYARGTGYGIRGAMRLHGGFDFPSSWCRSGSGYMTTMPGSAPVLQPGSVGDLCGGATLAGAIAAALFRRERTGKGAIVDNALYLIGLWIMGQSVLGADQGLEPKVYPRHESFDALLTTYRTKDDRWLSLCLLMPQWWPDFARHIERPDLIDNPLFATPPARLTNRGALMSVLDEVFAQRTLSDWIDQLQTLEGVWSPLLTPEEVTKDQQALENGFVTPVKKKEGGSYLAAASPAQFDEKLIGELKAAPAFAADTDAVMRELDFSDAEIAAMRSAKIII
jgi:formyl-CoA transferase